MHLPTELCCWSAFKDIWARHWWHKPLIPVWNIFLSPVPAVLCLSVHLHDLLKFALDVCLWMVLTNASFHCSCESKSGRGSMFISDYLFTHFTPASRFLQNVPFEIVLLGGLVVCWGRFHNVTQIVLGCFLLLVSEGVLLLHFLPMCVCWGGGCRPLI